MSAATMVHQPWCNDHGEEGSECTHAFRVGGELVADVSEERNGGHVLIAWGPTGQPVTPNEARQVAVALYQAASLVESLTAPVDAVSQAERDTGSGLHCPSWCTQHNPDPADGSCSHFHEVNKIGGIAAVTAADGQVREGPLMFINDLRWDTTPEGARGIAADMLTAAAVVERLSSEGPS